MDCKCENCKCDHLWTQVAKNVLTMFVILANANIVNSYEYKRHDNA